MEQSLFEHAGGAPAMLALATAHHERCLADPELSHAFTHGDLNPEHVPRLAAYWGEVLGGPPVYSESISDQTATLALHAGNGDMGDFGERFLSAFIGAMDDAGLPQDEAFRAAMTDYMRWAVDDFLSYTYTDDVGTGHTMPRWGWDGLEGYTTA